MDYRDTEFLVNLHKKLEKRLKNGLFFDEEDDKLNDLETIFLINTVEDITERDFFNGVNFYENKLKEFNETNK